MNKSTHTRNIEAIADLLSECDEAIEHIRNPETVRLIRIKREAKAKAAHPAPKEDNDA